MSDLVLRMDAIQACQVGPSDEWAKATKSGYMQAATDCARNILRIEPQPDPRDEVIKGLVAALNTIHARAITTRGDQAYREFPRFAEKVSRAAIAVAKAMQP